MRLLETMKHDILLADGAMATQLQKEGLPKGALSAKWNIDNPAAVTTATTAYIDAGSKLVRTNTFGANQPVLQQYGLADREDEINKKGAELALECASKAGVMAAGSVGPTGLHFVPAGYEDFDAAVQIFDVQIRALKEAGISILCFESFTDITELRACLMAAAHIGGLETIACMSFQRNGSTATDTPADACAVVCQSLGADVVGANCGPGPAAARKAVDAMTKVASTPLCALPSAGVPDQETGKYPIGADQFARDMMQCVDSGARLIGGCCGTDPSYIKALCKMLQGQTIAEKSAHAADTFIASPLGVADLALDGLNFTQMDLRAVRAQLEVDDFQSVSYALPADWEFCDACVLDFHGMEDDFDVQKLVTAVTLYLKKPVILSGGAPQLIELFLQYYPGRAAVQQTNNMPDYLFGAMVVGEGYKPISRGSNI